MRNEVTLDCPAPIGCVAGFLEPLGTGLASPIDQYRDDVASPCLETESMEMALEPVGRPEVDPVLGHRERSLHRAGCLELLQPSGTSTLLSSGWITLGEDVGSVTLALDPVAAFVPVDHRIRLALGAWDFPRCWPGSSLALRVITGDAHYRRAYVEPHHDIDAALELRSELATPSRAALVIDERCRAASPGKGTCADSIEATVKLVAKLSDASHCNVEVKASFTAEAGHALGVDGRRKELLLDVEWASKALS